MQQLIKIFAVIGILLLAILALLHVFGLMDIHQLQSGVKMAVLAIGIVAIASLAITLLSGGASNDTDNTDSFPR